MAQSIGKIEAKLMREYYKYFSKYAKGKTPENKVAWVTAFTPVELLEALNISYYYPESYAAVIAASGQEQELLTESDNQFLCRDCCSYSCCIEGCVQLEEGPRGVPPKPDVLIATNNQCNTLPAWWNILAARYNVPLIVLDYPGENVQGAEEYVKKQHLDLICQMEKMSGNKMNIDALSRIVDNSAKSVSSWMGVIQHLKDKDIKPTILFDDINYLITARCKPETSELYEMMEADVLNKPDADKTTTPLFWLGYPLWYHDDRYLSEALEGCRISGSNYITWWCLDYCGVDPFERLYNAYNYTFLNLPQHARDKKLRELIKTSEAVGAISLHNKSCKCDFVSAKNIEIPQVELDIDMIDRTFLDVKKAKEKVDLLRSIIC